MKPRIARYLKLIAVAFLFLVFSNCQKNDTETPKETAREKRLKRITLNDLDNRLGNSTDYKKLTTLFDRNKKQGSQHLKGLDASDHAWLITDEIVAIQKEDITFYTFKIGTYLLGNEFYNLVTAVDGSGTILSIRVLEYRPSDSWLNDTSQPFTGTVKLIENTFFTESDISDSLGAKVGIGDCVVGLDFRWECNVGNNHAPNTCPAGGSELIIFPEYGNCPVTDDPGNDIGSHPVDPGSSPGGGSSENGEDPCNADCHQDQTTPIRPLSTSPAQYLTGILGLDIETQNWLENSADDSLLEGLFIFIDKNYTIDGKTFAKEAIKVYKASTAADEKAVVDALLNGDLETASDILLKGATFTNSQCPPHCNDIYFDAPVDLTASLIIGAVDGLFNLYRGTSIYHNTWEEGKIQEGQFIAKLLKKQGISIPDDMDPLLLNEMFKVRSRKLEFKVERANEDYLDTLADLSISLLDVVAIISPGSGSGAYLLAKTGGNITVKALADYLKLISVTTSKIDGLVNNLKTTAKFELNGTGAYKTVGGHHPLAKIAFDTDDFYKFREAFSISPNTLETVWKNANPNKSLPRNLHSKITGQQNSLYSAFAKTGERLTLGKMTEIEIKAMTNMEIPKDIAEGWVVKALEDIKTQGVKLITNIPWNGKN